MKSFKDETIISLHQQINEQSQKIAMLEKEIKNRDKALQQMQFTNDDLTARLTRTLQLDASAHNQELMTVRTNISNALKLEYQDYQDNKGAEMSEDQFEAFKASLFRIFKTLKRFGIALN